MHIRYSAYLARDFADQIGQNLVPYYERFGFVSKGPSRAQFGGGGWIDLVGNVRLNKVTDS